MAMLTRRTRWDHWADSLCTHAPPVRIVIAALFLDAVKDCDPSCISLLFFILVMFALVSGLLRLLREIFVAIGNLNMQIIN
jgi:hypothetical protein